MPRYIRATPTMNGIDTVTTTTSARIQRLRVCQNTTMAIAT